jgi:hypothetical protein
MAARAIGTLTETPPAEEEEDEEEDDDEELDDEDELDIEEEEDEDDDTDDDESSDPPLPQAGRMAAQATMLAINTGAMRRSSLPVAFDGRSASAMENSGLTARGGEFRFHRVERASSRIFT